MWEFGPIGERFGYGPGGGGGACADPGRHFGLRGDIESGPETGKVIGHGAGTEPDASGNIQFRHSAEQADHVGLVNGNGVGDAGGNPGGAEFCNGGCKFPLAAGGADVGVGYKIDGAGGMSAVGVPGSLKGGEDFIRGVAALAGVTEHHAGKWHIRAHPCLLDIQ